MPKNNSVASIRTLWENNPDTPMSAANLSRLQDVTASYLNTDGTETEFTGLHVEGGILFADPVNSSRLMLKRGTIIQIINEAVDDNDVAIAPKNSQYKLFDVGLEDIILTWADTDDTNLAKTTWGQGTNEYFVFICDKDDDTIYNKNSTDEYGGGAQILISKSNEYPSGQVPGRPENNYSKGDTRLIGGFKTNGDTILSASIWDISGKFQSVKAKAYYILDEYKTGGAEYRKIQLKDLDTNTINTFDNNLTVNGNLTSGNASVQDISAKNTTIAGTVTQSAGVVSVAGQATLSGPVILNNTTVINGATTINANVAINDKVITVKKGTATIASIDAVTPAITLASDITHTGSYTQTGNDVVNGNLTVTGNTVLGGNAKTLTVTGNALFNNQVSFADDMLMMSTDALTTVFNVKQDTQEFIFQGQNTYIKSPVTIDGELILNSGAQNISLASTKNIFSSTGTGYEWQHMGSFKVDGSDHMFTVQSSNTNKIIEVNTNSKQVTINGIVDFYIPDDETFTVKDSLSNTIFGVEYDDVDPTEMVVAINRLLKVSAGGGNALVVTGNASVSGSLTVGGVEIGGGGVSGNAATASKLQTARTITLSGNVTGSFSFDGSSNVNVTTMVVDDSHNHDSRYYTETELKTSGSAVVHWGNISSKPSVFAPSIHDNSAHSATYITASGVNFTNMLANGGVTVSQAAVANTDTNGVATTVARSDHKHDGSYFLKSSGAAGIPVPTSLGITYQPDQYTTLIADDVEQAFDYVWKNFNLYPKMNTSVFFSSLSASSISVSGNINADAFVATKSVTVGLGNTDVSNDKMGVLFGNGSTQYQLWTATDGSLRFGNQYVNVGSASDSIAKAVQLSVPQTLALTGTGISGSLIGKIGDGSAGVTLNANLDFGITSGTVASGDHIHSTFGRSSALATAEVFSNITVTNGIVTGVATKTLTPASIGASATGHMHDYTTLTSIDWSKVVNKPSPVITLVGDVTGSGTMSSLGSVSINATVADDSHTHDTQYYTKADVQIIVQKLIDKINAMQCQAGASSFYPLTDIDSSGLF